MADSPEAQEASSTSSATQDPTSAPVAAVDASGRPWPAFAHGSEGEMARILDFYAVHWEYEPRTFPILWNLDGDVVESFSPDFYLPELDVFLELTTLKQRLVRKKNRKLRRLRELYPDIRIKLFYARDFRAIMLKYGRLAFADALSGTIGQVVPDRAIGGGALGAAAEVLEVLDEAIAAPIPEPAPDGLGADPGAPPEPPEPPEPSLDGPVAAAPPTAAGRRPTSRSRRRRAARAAAKAAVVAAAEPAVPMAEEDHAPR